MNIYLTHGSTTRDVTNILSAWTWSGDKAAISRQLSADFAYIEGSSLPVPEVGDLLTMADGEKKAVHRRDPAADVRLGGQHPVLHGL